MIHILLMRIVLVWPWLVGFILTIIGVIVWPSTKHKQAEPSEQIPVKDQVANWFDRPWIDPNDRWNN